MNWVFIIGYRVGLFLVFTGQEPNDIDVYFPTKKMADQAVGKLKKQGFEIKKEWETNRILNKKVTYDVIHEFNNPNQIFNNFDYTICMAYLDCEGILEMPRRLFYAHKLRKIVRNKDYITNHSKFKKTLPNKRNQAINQNIEQGISY